jgi:hypothetical protein|tara:strand:- start:245 stop:736 length:492 start_codon:yes stop_codon:yes gene_type:complete
MKKLILVFCLAMTGQIYGQIITGNDYLSWKSDENMSDISYFYMSGMMTGISLSLAYGNKQSFTRVSFSEALFNRCLSKNKDDDIPNSLIKEIAEKTASDWTDDNLPFTPEDVTTDQLIAVFDKWIEENPEIRHLEIQVLCLASILETYGGEGAKHFVSEIIKN